MPKQRQTQEHSPRRPHWVSILQRVYEEHAEDDNMSYTYLDSDFFL